MSSQLKISRSFLTAIVAVVALAGATSAQAAGPVKLDLTGHIGTGSESSAAGGLASPQGVSVSPQNGNVYVAELLNRRIQEFAPDGKFVLMFGKEVNETKDNIVNATEAEKGVCETGTGDVCKTGVESVAAGQFSRPQSVAIDPVSGNVIIAEYLETRENGEVRHGQRVQEFTPDGKFVFEIGKEVNKTKKTNLCTELEVEKETVECGSPVLNESGLPEVEGEHGTFNFREIRGNVLASGGPKDLIYVGEANRVQEFEADGTWHGEIPVGSEINAVALDPATGDLYVAKGFGGSVSEFGPLGEELAGLVVSSQEANGSVEEVRGMAVDSTGHIAISGREERGPQSFGFGLLYATAAGHALISRFNVPLSAGVRALAFSANGAIDKDEMYAAAEVAQEILSYTPKPVGEVKTEPETCKPGAEQESNVTFECTFTGQANPFKVAKTEVWFQFGRTCTLGSETAKQPLEPPGEVFVPISAIEALRPNSNFCYRLAGSDENAPASEPLTGERLTFNLPAVLPNLIGQPSALVGSPSSAVMFGELNPENSSSEYFFEYALANEAGKEPLAGCPGGLIKGETCAGVSASATLSSALYGKTGATIETTGLQPNTTYQFRLAARNEAGSVIGATKEFTTLPKPSLVAFTGGFSGVTTTSAVISGSVNTDGQAGTYSFQLGIYNPAGTQYGTLLSGSTGFGGEEKAMLVTGLQPGTTYAYRIVVQTANGGVSIGEAHAFSTLGSPAVIPVPVTPPQLATPNIPFPKVVKTSPPKKPKAKKKGKGKKKKRKAKKGKRK